MSRALVAYANLLTVCTGLLTAPAVRAADAADGDEPPAARENSIRVGLVGAWQKMFDLDIWGAGALVTFGREGDRAGGFGTLRFVEARTLGGLVVREGTLIGTAEWYWGGGWRAGLGGGCAYFALVRATTGEALQSFGPLLVGLVGYDFGLKPNFYVLGTLEAQIQGGGLWGSGQSYGGAFVLGPTLQTGVRF